VTVGFIVTFIRKERRFVTTCESCGRDITEDATPASFGWMLEGHANRCPMIHGQFSPTAVDEWVITEFDPKRLVGVITNLTKRPSSFTFHSTSFASDTSQRWPRVGEIVAVAFTTHGTVLSVHGK
jgi:hypothetical protein